MEENQNEKVALTTDLPQFAENQLLGESLGIDGPQEIRWLEGKQTLIPIEPITSKSAFPKKFRAKHGAAFRIFSDLVAFAKETKDRKLPVLKSEALQLIGKQEFKDLKHMGYIQTRLVEIESPSRQKMGGRVVCWMKK